MRLAIAHADPLAVAAIRSALVPRVHVELAWVAVDRCETLRRCRADSPDLLLLALDLPPLDGVAATRQIMAESPCAILLLSDGAQRSLSRVYDAMIGGALDVVSGSFTDGDPRSAIEALLQKIDLVGRLVGRSGAPCPNPGETAATPATPDRLVALGASIGGPHALGLVLSGLTRDLPAAVVIVQHMDAGIAPTFAESLTRSSGFPVRIATPGERPVVGQALLAATDAHLVLTASGTLRYQTEPTETAYCPSVDVFFHSLAIHGPPRSVAVLLTGMGEDGARGLEALRRAGWLTIAQDRRTSVVYGMPRAAAETGAAKRILPLDGIAGAIRSHFGLETAIDPARLA
jgi:two-component system, chemotaxis family, response regulator WspF